MRYSGFPRYVPVDERRAKAERKIKEMRKKNPDIRPVVIEGRASLARTWWGRAWNRNLEGYADYHNRIARGRSYVRHMAVIDLQINPGHVAALVVGSRSKPYSVDIRIKPLPAKIWNAIIKDCAGQVHSMQELLAGQFPRSIGERFTSRKNGLFPSPEEIAFDCSCPDWAYMCKHVAAALYGIGARLDESPELFFTLRNADVQQLAKSTVRGAREHLLSRAGENRGKEDMDNAELSEMFGIEMDEAPAAKPATTRKAPKKSAKSKKSQRTPGRQVSGDTEAIFAVIRRSKKGIDFAGIQKKTGLPEQKIR
ncbi:MAG: SWIM zinc finger family protein, partial [bacterium]